MISVELKNINKSFSGVKVLDNVNLTVQEGSIHALMGENGAGKSTLMKILNGIYIADEGEIFINEAKREITNAKDAQEIGIAMIHQELSVVDEMTIIENIFLGREIIKSNGLLDKKMMYRETDKLLKEYELHVKPDTYMNDLSVAQLQMIEIIKAVSKNSSIIVMDEPTSALTETEIKLLFKTIRELKKQQKSIIYISHKINEIFEICDEITVLRDGKFITTDLISNFTFERLISSMVGRELSEIYPKDNIPTEDVILEVENLSRKGKFKDVSFSLMKGEILGFSGLVGAGRSDVIEAVFGYKPAESGKIKFEGKELSIKKPKDALDAGITFISEDRKKVGLNLLGTIRENITLSNLNDYCKYNLIIDKKKEKLVSKSSIIDFRIKSKSIEMETMYLSGGNQQKVLLAKCISCNPRIIIMDEPTRGIDVGSKAEIYKLMSDFVKHGNSIIMVSSEMPEVIGMSDRIIVMHEGKVTGLFKNGEFNQEEIMACAAGKERGLN